jgi:hypothetical protein
MRASRRLPLFGVLGLAPATPCSRLTFTVWPSSCKVFQSETAREGIGTVPAWNRQTSDPSKVVILDREISDGRPSIERVEAKEVNHAET